MAVPRREFLGRQREATKELDVGRLLTRTGEWQLATVHPSSA